jgi:hypothetical protein
MTTDQQHIPTPDMEPDLNVVQQVETDDYHTIPVKVCEPVEARELPTKRIAPRTVTVDTVAGGKLLSADPRRKFATIIARTQDITIGATQAQAQLNGAWVPGVVPFVVSTVGELWATGDGGTTDVSVIEEYWA